MRRMLAAALLLICCPLVLAQPDDLLSRARQLLDAGQSEQAFELLLAESEQHAGNPDFDLALGITALEAGHPTQAVFALERVLVVDPGNPRARTHLARAYYEMGENEAAKQEFKAAKRETLPPATVKAVDEYLTAIESRIAAGKRRIDIFIEAAAGYDSNVNSATDLSTVAVPAFGNLVFNLDRTGRELDSAFYELGAGMRFSSPFMHRDDLRIFGAADLHYRTPFHEPDFSTIIGNGQVGLRLTRDRNAYLVSLLAQKYYLDEFDGTRDQGGVQLQWLHAYSDRTQFSLFGQATAQRFPDQHVRDVNQFLGGAGFVHVLAHEGDPIIYGSLFGGTDDERFSANPHIGRTFAGARLGGQYNWSETVTLIGNLSYQYSRYGADDPLFQERRKDDFIFARAGLEYKLNKNWMVRPEVQYSTIDSTLPINDFDRWQALITVRNLF